MEKKFKGQKEEGNDDKEREENEWLEVNPGYESKVN